MHRDDKQRVIGELTGALRASEALIVTDYRGLTMPQVDALRGQLLEHGARFSVVKNTLTRRAAQDAGVDALLALLEGPSAIAFIESEGSVVEVAKALTDSARDTKVLVIRGGLMQGRTISSGEIEELSKLPPFDVLRGQVLGAVCAPLTGLLGLLGAPVQALIGLIDARIEQLGGVGAASGPAAVTEDAPVEAQPAAPTPEEPPAGEAQPSDREGESPGDAEAEPPAADELPVAAEAVEAEESTGSQTDTDDQEVDDGGS